MKKNLLFAMVALFLCGTSTFSQYYYVPHLHANTNPGGLNTDNEYPFGGGQPPGWTAIDVGGVVGAPRWSSNATIPFAFNFNGNPVTDLKASTSGVLTFDITAVNVPDSISAALPNATIPNNSVCVWGLAALGTNDYISTKTFGAAPNRQFWIHYSSYSLPGPAANTCWTYWSIVLEETTNKIYIVDQRSSGCMTSLSAGIQIDNSTAIQITGSPNLQPVAGTDFTPADNTYYEFIYGSPPAYDMSALSIGLYPTQALSMAPYTIAGNIVNYGTSTVNSFDLNYSVNGGTTVTSPISSVSIMTDSMYTYTHPSAWTPGSTGVYTIAVWASNINGNVDQNMMNDTIYKTINVVSAVTQMIPLHEIFSSSTCGPCVAGSQNIDGVIFPAEPNKFTVVHYCMNWPGAGDPYYTTECGTRGTYYNVTGIPDMRVEGWHDYYTPSYTTGNFDTEYQIPAFVNISSTFNVNGTNVSCTATINPLVDNTSVNLKLFMAIIEETTYNNVSTNGETVFHHVFKKMMPGITGQAVAALTAGTPVTFTKTYNFPTPNTVEEFSDLRVVVWLQDYTTQEVFQSIYATNVTSTGDFEADNGIMSVYPNPVNTKTNIELLLSQPKEISVEVMDITGKTVMTINTGKLNSGKNKIVLPVEGLESGLYLVHLNAGTKSYSTKIIVQK